LKIRHANINEGFVQMHCKSNHILATINYEVSIVKSRKQLKRTKIIRINNTSRLFYLQKYYCLEEMMETDLPTSTCKYRFQKLN